MIRKITNITIQDLSDIMERKLSYSDLAKRFNCHEASVRQYIDKHYPTFRRKLRERLSKLAENIYEMSKFMSKEDVAKLFNVSIYKVKQCIEFINRRKRKNERIIKTLESTR